MFVFDAREYPLETSKAVVLRNTRRCRGEFRIVVQRIEIPGQVCFSALERALD